jgi:hypothetical protein
VQSLMAPHRKKTTMLKRLLAMEIRYDSGSNLKLQCSWLIDCFCVNW